MNDLEHIKKNAGLTEASQTPRERESNLRNLETGQRVALIYQWVKTGVIGLSEFRHLVSNYL